MQTHIGTKSIKAKPMNRLEYNEYRGWDLPEDENPEDEGYLVEYIEGGQANHPDHEGYISWSPKNVFDNAYQNVESGVSFGHAVELMKEGRKVARAGWNGRNMWLILVPGSKGIRPVSGTPYSKAGLTEEVDIEPHIDMYTAQGAMQPGWLASQTDMLANDWIVVG